MKLCGGGNKKTRSRGYRMLRRQISFSIQYVKINTLLFPPPPCQSNSNSFGNLSRHTQWMHLDAYVYNGNIIATWIVFRDDVDLTEWNTTLMCCTGVAGRRLGWTAIKQNAGVRNQKPWFESRLWSVFGLSNKVKERKSLFFHWWNVLENKWNTLLVNILLICCVSVFLWLAKYVNSIESVLGQHYISLVNLFAVVVSL